MFEADPRDFHNVRVVADNPTGLLVLAILNPSEHLPTLDTIATISQRDNNSQGTLALYGSLHNSLRAIVEELTPLLGLPENGAGLMEYVRASYALHAFAHSAGGVAQREEMIDTIRMFTTLLAALAVVKHIQCVLLPLARHNSHSATLPQMSDLWVTVNDFGLLVVDDLTERMSFEKLVCCVFRP